MELEIASALDTANWSSLVYGVEQGACTLMLGPNAVTGTFDGEGRTLSRSPKPPTDGGNRRRWRGYSAAEGHSPE